MAEATCCRVKSLADRWDCSPAKIRRMIDAGKLPAIRLDGMVRIPLSAVLEIEAKTECPQTASRDSAESQGAIHGTSITSANASLRAARIARRLN